MGWRDAPVVGAGSWRDAPVVDEEPPTTAPRMIGQFSQNANDAIAGIAGAPVDLMNAGLRQVGMNVDRPFLGSESIKSGIDYVAALPGRIHDWTDIMAPKPGSLTDDRTSRFDPQNRAEKIAAGVGQGVGTAASVMMPAAAIANTARAGTVTQGVAKALTTQPGTQLASAAAGGGVTGATDDPLLGLAAALAVPVGAAVGRGAITPTTNRLSGAEKRLIEVAKREGVPLTPSQATGSPTLRTVEETMAKLPLSSGPMRGTYEGQRAALNRAIMSRTGAAADDAAPETLRRIYGQAGQTFDDLASRTTLTADKQLAGDITKAVNEYGRRLPTDVAPVLQSYADDFAPLIDAVTKGQNPQISGEVYKTIYSDITKRMRNTSNPDLKEALGSIRKALDGAVDRSSAPALLKEWKQARSQYAALKTVDKAMQGGTQADRAPGTIPLGAFSGAVRANDKTGFARARGQYGELAKLADYLAPKIPDSGTITRGTTANILTGGALFAGSAGMGAGIPAAATAAVAPWAASKLYNTPLVQSYLTNQAVGPANLRALWGSEAARRLAESGGDDPAIASLARALRRGNEKRQGASR